MLENLKQYIEKGKTLGLKFSNPLSKCLSCKHKNKKYDEEPCKNCKYCKGVEDFYEEVI